MNRKRKQGSTIKSDAREIIAKVAAVCEAEAIDGLKLPLISKTQRAAMYTGVSKSTIKKIKAEDHNRHLNNPERKLISPGKKRARQQITDKINDFDFQVIRRTIEDLYLNKKIPSCRKLLIGIREKIDFPFKERILSTLLKKNGFCWRKCQNNKKILIEKPNIVTWRLKYLRSIRKHRTENKSIIYIAETWIDNGITVRQCDEVFGVGGNASSSSSGGFMMIHGGSVNGFVENAGLVFRSGTPTGQMNKDNFERWLNIQLFPNIPAGSVIVMDNTPYHSEILNKVPTKYSTKPTMITWLQDRNIPHDPDSRKSDLFEIITAHKPTEKTYKIDEIIRAHGHFPLRLPPYICDLNSIELAWVDVKRYVREHNGLGALSLNDLEKLTEEGIATITKTNWEGYTKHVIDIENRFWETDEKIEEIVDQIIINLGENSRIDEDMFASSSSEEEDGQIIIKVEGSSSIDKNTSASSSSEEDDQIIIKLEESPVAIALFPSSN